MASAEPGTSTQKTIVQKYGGSSVGTVEKLKRVAELVVAKKRAGHQLVVVVSAMGDTTDELLDLAKRTAPSPPRRELDMLLTCGERISMALLAMAIDALGEKAVSLTGSQSGILTNDNHFAAKIIEVRPFRIEDELARGNIVIVAGYQGMSYRREVTTLGRGGSDTTAVALAAALNADACEIYSDVDGVLSADPRAVPDAVKLPSISYEEMLAFSGAGAKVLNAQAVAFAREAKIRIYARKTDDPNGAGTLIELSPTQTRPVAGVALKRDARLVTGPASAASKTLRAAQEHRAAVECLQVVDGRFSVILDLENVTADAALQAAVGKEYKPVDVVSCVGFQVGQNLEVLAELAEITPADRFAELHRIALIVPPGEGPLLLELLHTHFVH